MRRIAIGFAFISGYGNGQADMHSHNPPLYLFISAATLAFIVWILGYEQS